MNCYLDHALIGEGSRVVEADIRRSIIGRDVRIDSGAYIEDSVIFDHTHIGAGAKLQRVVIDRHNTVQAGVELGNRETVMSGTTDWAGAGVTVLPKPSMSKEEQNRRLSSY